jgi:hypothetical protein
MKFLTTFCMWVFFFTSVVFAQAQDSISNAQDSLAKKDLILISVDTLKNADTVIFYSISIKTEPDSAVVVVDGSVRGMSPLNVTNMKSGEHSIVLKKKGFYQKKVSLIVDSVSTKELSIILQQPGSLTITSAPSGSEVIWSGEKKGVTPLNLTLIKPGKYSLQLKKDQFITFEKSINISSGKSDSVFCSMSADTAFTNAAKREEKQLRFKKTKITSIVLAVAFGLFAAIVAIVDLSGDQ